MAPFALTLALTPTLTLLSPNLTPNQVAPFADWEGDAKGAVCVDTVG